VLFQLICLAGLYNAPPRVHASVENLLGVCTGEWVEYKLLVSCYVIEMECGY